jgi:hypothetical protein
MTTPDRKRSTASPTTTRRALLGNAGKLAAGGLLASGAAASHANPDDGRSGGIPDLRELNERGGDSNRQLLRKTLRVRVERAQSNHQRGVPQHRANGDEERYANKIGTDTRGLPHNERGEVDLKAYATLKHALNTQDPADFEKIILGGTRKLVNPLGTLAVNLTGLAEHQIALPPAPALASAERAAEAVEAYWQSLLRDVPFFEYRDDTSHPLVRAAVAEINQLSAYTGPRDASGRVTPSLLFRGTARYLDRSDASGSTARHAVPPGVAVGPYISQFILKDIPYGVQSISALLRTQLPGNDFLATPAEWLANQDGKAVTRRISFDPQLRYLATGRDLAEYAHGGSPSFWGASQILSNARSSDPTIVGGIGAALNPRNPYLKLKATASGSGSFGAGYVQSLLPLSTSREIRANYWQKWFVHRTLRPEAYGGLLHQRLANGVNDYPLHAEILRSDAVERSFRKFGGYLLSSAYPEGAPNHGSYPGGASSNAAINATILKAFYDEDFVIPDPVQPDPSDPTRLIPYTGTPLTVGGELNKLATNLGQGRNWAGIHWRSDAAASLPQAEELAISLLRDEKHTFREAFEGFRFTRFDGSVVEI